MDPLNSAYSSNPAKIINDWLDLRGKPTSY
jgi:hypothetical protein